MGRLSLESAGGLPKVIAVSGTGASFLDSLPSDLPTVLFLYIFFFCVKANIITQEHMGADE